jgi:hypothetical protein
MTARKRKSAALEDLFEPTASEQDFDEFIDEIGENGSIVEIYRIERTERQHLDVAEFSEVRPDPYGYLRARFGPGKYSLKFKSADRKYQGNKTLIVGSQVRMPDTPGAAVVPAALAPRDDLVEKLLLAMVASQKPPDLGAMMTGLGAVLSALNKPQPAADPVAMFAAVTKAASDMKGPQKDEDWLDRVEKVVTVVKALTPDNGPPDSVWGVVRDIGKEVVHRLPPLLPAAVPEEVAAVETKTPGGAMPQASQADWVKSGLTYLKSKARAKKDAGLFIDFMFENSEEPQWNAILGAVQQGATFEHLLQFDPEIGQNPELKAWFQTLYDGIHSNIFEHVDTGGEGRDTGNTRENGGAKQDGPQSS